ncbi:DoxX family membrane protein [Radiobacillus kanasensis]|uniref:DoxX family membrane protein n=1 Tax=Radiobacillus kanasensis TaxID=2844358 RepID=UPI001E48CB4E|nr:DoxX family membrane protein [Radiobacillus kanasensis]UFU00434.1 DoxX family membrane protein [Radiobacillus kanasensis]
MIRKFLSLGLIVLVCLSPLAIYGHVKWFATKPPVKIPIEDILSPLFLTVSLLIAVLLAVLTQVIPLLMHIPIFKKINDALEGLRKYSRYILKYGTAGSLIIQVLSGTMFAPDFAIDHTWQTLVMWFIIIGLLIPHHIATKAAAIVMLGLFATLWVDYGWFYMLDYGFYVAIIGVLLLWNTKLENWGFPFLYLGTGLSLCWVAVEKWVYPSMTIEIIEHHGVPTFGFDPSVFIVLAAFIEFVVGYLLVVGILNRVLAIVVTVIFILTTMIFGMTEIIGHAMIHIILIIFVIEGVSFYYPPIKIHRTKLDQMVFVFLNFLFVLSTFILIYYRFG